MKKATETSTDRAHSLVHPSMKKAMKRSAHLEVLASSSPWWAELLTAYGSLDFSGLFPDIPVDQTSESSMMTETSDDDEVSTYSCDLLESCVPPTPRHQELGGQTEYGFVDLEDWTYALGFSFDASTEQRSVDPIPASDSTCQELDEGSMMTETTTAWTDDDMNACSNGMIEGQREMDQFVGIGAEVLPEPIQAGEFVEYLEASQWIETGMDSPPQAVMTGEQSRAIADSFQRLGIR